MEYQNFVLCWLLLYEFFVIRIGYNIYEILHFFGGCTGDLLPFHSAFVLGAVIMCILRENLDGITTAAIVDGELFAELLIFLAVDGTNGHDAVHLLSNLSKLILKAIRFLALWVIEEDDPDLLATVELGD